MQAPITLASGSTTDPFLVNPDGWVVIEAGSASVTLQYTTGTPTDIAAGTATWITSGSFTGYTAIRADEELADTWVKLTASGGAITYHVEGELSKTDRLTIRGYKKSGINNFGATYATDSSGNVTGLVGPSGGVALKTAFTTAQPYKAAFWGDSRYNAFSSTSVDISGSGTTMSMARTPTWATAFLGDTEYSKSYAVSGDTASAWQSTSRANGKTFASLNTSDADVVFIQYGVNDAIAGTSAATIVGYLQNLIAEIFKSGKLVVFESIYPVNTPCANYVAAQAIIDSVNALMQSWLAQFSTQAVYVDTATTFKAGGTYASYTYMAAADGLHQTRLGAYTAGKLLAAGARAILPKRVAEFYGPASPAQNLCNITGSFPITTQFNSANAGTATVTQGSGQDSKGYYYEWVVTPTAFGTTFQTQYLQLSANFQTANPPYYALAGNEILQGGARVVIDDGNGGAPNAYAFALRHRFFTAAIFADFGASGVAAAATDSNYSEAVDVQVLTPKLTNTAASVVASPANGSGYVLSLIVDSQALNVPYRVRIYNPQLRRVGYSSTPVAVTPPASASAYTNSTNAPQQVFFAGGTVSAISINGVATGLTSGVFVLNPNDTLTPTYTVAPTTFTVQQLLTQPSLRGLI